MIAAISDSRKVKISQKEGHSFYNVKTNQITQFPRTHIGDKIKKERRDRRR